MKKLMMVLVAAMGFTVLAEEMKCPEGCPCEGGRPNHDRGMFAERGKMMNDDKGGMFGDPAVMAVFNPRIAEKIGLDEKVREELGKIDGNSRQKLKGLKEELRAAMEKQAKLMRAEKIDEEAVMAAIDELFGLRKKIAKTQTKRVIKVKALLTPEQLRKAVKEMRAFGKEHKGKRFEGEGKHGPKDEEMKRHDKKGEGRHKGKDKGHGKKGDKHGPEAGE